jgi:tyrosinase
VPLREEIRDVSLPYWQREYAPTLVRLMNEEPWRRGVEAHIATFNTGAAHQGPAFGPWHDEFLRWLEDMLMATNPNIKGLLYFDVTRNPMEVFNNDFLGGPGDPNNDDQVLDGPFRDYHPWVYDPVDGTFFESDLVITRSVTASGFPTGSAVSSVVNKQEVYDRTPWDATASAGERNYLEGWREPNIHNAIHSHAVRGIMRTSSSPNDPVFWLIHCYIAKLFRQWYQLKMKELAQRKRQFWRTYRPVTGGPEGHNLNDSMRNLPGPARTPKQALAYVQGQVRYA